MGNAIPCKFLGIDSIRIKMFDGTVKILTGVRHVPEIRKNLISLGVLDTGGYKSIVQGGVMKVYKGILQVMKANKVGNLLLLEGRTESDHVTTISNKDSDYVQLWHQWLGHMSEQGLNVLFDRKLLPSLKSLKLDFCKHCIYGKQNMQKFKMKRHTNEGILDYIHSDVWGPSPTVSYGGSSYFVSFIDDFSRKVWIYMLKSKDDVFTVFKQFRDLVEKSTDRSIKCLRTDNGGEFTSMEFENYCKEFGINRHKATAYTPK
jgi:transposase InsO family protein